MTDEELSISDATLIARLHNLYAMLEEEGYYTKANTVAYAADRIKALLQAVRHANDHADVAIADMQSAEDRIKALVKERDRYRDAFNTNCLVLRGTEERVERLEAAVIAAAKIGQIVGFLGEDEGRIEAFREACGPELWAKARAALKGVDHD